LYLQTPSRHRYVIPTPIGNERVVVVGVESQVQLPVDFAPLLRGAFGTGSLQAGRALWP
jgi:hypothetical protein